MTRPGRRGAPLSREARPQPRDDRRRSASATRRTTASALQARIWPTPGFTVEEMIASGMLIGGDDIPVAYDRFRHRVMFPIADLQGRVIAFGGRALDPDAPAKYLNSPETPLFHKGQRPVQRRTARGPAHDKDRIIAVEGYMDVIALTEAGFPEAVAPLGTALTEEQVKLLWRMAPRADPLLRRRRGRPQGGLPRRRYGAAAPEARASACASPSCPTASIPTISCASRGREAFAAELARTRAAVRRAVASARRRNRICSTPEQRAAFEARLKALVGQDRRLRPSAPTTSASCARRCGRSIARVVREIAARRGPARTGRRAAPRRNNAAPDWRVRERARRRPEAASSRRAQRALGRPRRARSSASAARHWRRRARR